MAIYLVWEDKKGYKRDGDNEKGEKTHKCLWSNEVTQEQQQAAEYYIKHNRPEAKILITQESE